MTAIILPTTSMPGQYPQEGGGRLINAFAESLGETASSKLALRRAPGLAAFGTTAQDGFRGMQTVNADLYSAWDGKVVKHSASGGAGTALTGSLLGSLPVFWARNNAATTDLVAVAPGDGAFEVTDTAVSTYSDTDIGSPNSVCFVKGYFVFSYENGKMQASGINSTSINTLDYATAESKPDVLYRVIPRGDSQLLAAGSNTIEVWAINDEATGFPFSFVTAIPRGIAGRYCIGGHEDGFGRAIVFVGDDNAVYQLDGYSPTKISSPDLDRLIEAVTDKDDIKVGVFVSQGHAFASVRSSTWCWVYDFNISRWHERTSYQQASWRALQPYNAFGKWLCGDALSGNLLAVDGLAQTEVDQPLRAIVETGPMTAFPYGTRLNRLDLNVSVGIGNAAGIDPIQVDPVIDIYVSRDNGLTWSNPWQRKLGRQGVGLQKVTVNNMGHAGQQGVKLRFAVSDPVHFALMGGDLDAAVRAR